MKKEQTNEKPPLRLGLLGRSSLGMRPKLTGIFLIVKIIPIILLTIIAFSQIVSLAGQLRNIAVKDSTDALTARAVESIERLTTDTARDVARFLYGRDDDILYAAKLVKPGDEATTTANLKAFMESKVGLVVKQGTWGIKKGGGEKGEDIWVRTDKPKAPTLTGQGGISNNTENEDNDGFHYRDPDVYDQEKLYLYDEISYFENDGGVYQEKAKVVAKDGTDEYGNPVRAGKKNDDGSYILSDTKYNLSERATYTYGGESYHRYTNSFVKAETYLDDLPTKKGDIYVSDVIGAYTRSNYIGMYTEGVVKNASDAALNDPDRGYSIPYEPEKQAYAGEENPVGVRFKGIVRYVTPVFDGATLKGYIMFALNHDHIMELVDRVTPMDERYTELASAYDGNYAFIWDYKCRSICHPRHHSIYGFNPDTGFPETPWLEQSVYDAWQGKVVGVEGAPNDPWSTYVLDRYTPFTAQSRKKKPAKELTQAGLVGLDGRFLDNAPQCTGWMDLTLDGGSGSFYIFWSKIYKLTTAGAIPYYTGQYAPEKQNGSRRGFGIVTVGAGFEDFTAAAEETSKTLEKTINSGLNGAIWRLAVTVFVIIAAIVLIAVWIASSITSSIKEINGGMLRFRSGERQFRFNSTRKDEFGQMAESFDDMANGIVESVGNPLSIIDNDRKIIYMNDVALNFCRTTLDKSVGTDYADSSVYPAQSAYDPILALEQGREPEAFYDENSDRYLKGQASYLTDKNGEKKGYIIESHDITDMIKRQNEIVQQKRLLDEVLFASPDLIWYTDAEGRYLTVNPRFAAVAGLTPQEIAGKLTEEVLSGRKYKTFIERDKKALSTDVPVYSEDKLAFADGHTELLEAVRTPIIDNGKTVGMLGFARNITERARIEQELRNTQLQLEKAVEEANNASQHKGDFLARMSHEIRTPMNAIIGITGIVLNKLNEMESSETLTEVTAHMNQIENSSQHLLGLLNDILDISKIEAGKIELTDETVSIKRLLSTVAGIIRPRTAEKNINFITDFDEFDPDTFKCDSLRLRQVLINLLGNAVKFTAECGVIEFKAKKQSRAKGKTTIRFSVRDTGIGIAPEAQQHIFEAFEQGSGNITRKYGGTGLGLAISRRIVQLFGGDIELTSEMGEGSEFSFVITLQETDEKADVAREIEDVTGKFNGKRVLLVDDVDINRMIVKALLENSGAEIDEADDGRVAVDMFNAQPEFYYDIVLMDIKMPHMDGYEASSTIRSSNRTDAKTVPIIALTANAFKDDIDEAHKHGMNAHISKPVEASTLYQVLVKYLAK